MSKKEVRCPLRKECGIKCSYENRENECGYYKANNRPGYMIFGLREPVLETSERYIPNLPDSRAYTRAVMLDRKIKANTQAAQESLYEVCKGLKEMRDGKLYKELGYQNFEEYAENEVGISDRMCRKYIAIIENWNPGSDFMNLGVAKLYLLSTLSESDREEITQNNDVVEMSKRELEEKIKEIKMLNKEKSELAALNESLKESNESLRANSDKQSEVIDELEGKVEELESRPIEVAVTDNSEELEKIKKECEAKMQEIQEKYSDETSELIGKTAAEKMKFKQEEEKLKAEINDLQKKLEEQPQPVTETIVDHKATAKIYMENIIDSGNRLIGFVKIHSEFKDKAREIINAILSKVDEI